MAMIARASALLLVPFAVPGGRQPVLRGDTWGFFVPADDVSRTYPDRYRDEAVPQVSGNVEKLGFAARDISEHVRHGAEGGAFECWRGNPFIDPNGYGAFVSAARASYLAQWKREREGKRFQ